MCSSPRPSTRRFFVAESRAEIIALCDKAIGKLKEARAVAMTTAALQQELSEAGNDLEAPPSESIHPSAQTLSSSELSGEEMRSRLSAADQEVSNSRVRAQKIAAEIERRVERRKSLPEALRKCREQLVALDEALKHPVPDDQSLLAEAKRLNRLAQQRPAQ